MPKATLTPLAAHTLAEIDWTSWTPHERATLLFVRRDDEILLIRKKRGIGAGKINGPGGRIEAGESAAECAVREVHEELGVLPSKPRLGGQLSFQFRDGYALAVDVFDTFTAEGDAIETDEALPLWTKIDQLPFEEMWADDRIWLPHLLAARFFRGRFVFDGDTLLDHALEVDQDERSDFDR
jgi:8-oxo-dGTP diphosphatase